MTRLTTTLLAASAFALSSTAGFACGFHKTDTTASFDGDITTIESAELSTPATTSTTPSDSLATSDVETGDAPAETAE